MNIGNGSAPGAEVDPAAAFLEQHYNEIDGIEREQEAVEIPGTEAVQMQESQGSATGAKFDNLGLRMKSVVKHDQASSRLQDDFDKMVKWGGGMVCKFADNIKIGGVVDSEEGYLREQQDLDQMGEWAKEWKMEFNLNK
eukprot:g39510.t1